MGERDQNTVAGATARRRAATDQSGSALMFVLVVIVVLGLITAAIAGFAEANQRATNAYKDLRVDKYDADAAIKEAVNWAGRNDDVAIDPNYVPTSNEECVYHSQGDSGQSLTVSCETEAGSGAGVPPQTGISPPEALLLLGERHNEPGPYSYAKCSSFWDDAVKFFTGDTDGVSETSLYAKKRKRSTWGGIGSCTVRDRGVGPVRIEGDLTTAGQLSLQDGFKLEIAGGDGGVVKAQYGCIDTDGGAFDKGLVAPGGANISSDAQCNRTATDRDDPGKPWDGTSIYSDPGRINGSAFPIGDIRPEFLPVGFDSDGSLKTGYTLPTRTTAYVYDPTANTSGTAEVPKYLKPLTAASNSSGNCVIPAGTPVIFLWGRYTSAEVLNRYTANSACSDRTFWFAPDPGADRELLTVDDRTAAFYMDFADSGTGEKCGGMEAKSTTRWCFGGSDKTATSKPRVIVGWPLDWTSLPTVAPDGSGNEIGYGNRVGTYKDTAGAIEGNFLTYWSNTSKAAKVDTVPATYKPCVFNILWWLVPCPSFGERSLRMAKLTPAVAAGPIAEVGLPNGRMWVDVTFAMKNAAGTTPKIDVDYLDPRDGVAKNCSGSGGFTLVLDPSGPDQVLTNHAPGTSVPVTSRATISNADAATLANNCGSATAINNMRVTFRVDGNPWNTGGGGVPSYDLDGIRIYYDSYQGASFPLPVDENGTITPIGTTQPADPAKSDCDTTKPGGQLIFGGSSHVYVADGSLEVCGGPNPADPRGSMVIGIYGVPGVSSLNANSFAVDTASSGHSGTKLTNPTYAYKIGEPSAQQSADLWFKGGCIAFIAGGCWYGGFWPTDSDYDQKPKDLKFSFPGFPALPAGYSISQSSLRASYTTYGSAWRSDTGNTSITLGGCKTIAVKDWYDKVRHWANDTALKLMGCVTAAQITSGLQGVWKPRVADGFTWGFGWDLNGFDNKVEGVALDVEVAPTGTLSSPSDTTTPILRPQTGCVVAHPNYDGGESTPDCALVRADSYTADGSDATDGGLCIGTCPGRRTNWFGRVSVKGTIYAPSAALEFDDNDVGYPFATRGIIARHLRISGAKPRSNFTDPLIGSQLDETPAPRQAVFTACTQTPARRSAKEPCDPAQDTVLARSGVSFTVDPSIGVNATRATVPKVDWYTDERLS